MNKILYAFALAGVLGLSSCSDFLDQTSPSEMTAENTYASPYYTNLRVNKLYGGMAQDRTYAQDLSIVWNLNSDCELIDGLGSNATNTSSERGNMNYNMDPGWSKISGVWDAEYGIIEDANQIIEGIRSSATLTAGGANQKSMERSLGEALTIRAMVYFDLVRIFGDIPFKVEASKSDLSNAYLEKTDRDVIMDSLMNDLDEAIEYLPWADQATGYTTERTTKGYAHALLAQIAMTRAGYAIREKSKDGYETASYSDATYPTQRPGAADRKALYERALKHWSAIINDNTHNLNPSFENEWYLINQLSLDKTYHENLFEIPFGENVTGELGYTVGVRLSGVTTEYGYGNSSGKMKVTAPLLYSYDKKDTRRDITCANFEIKQDGSNTVENMLKNAPFGIYVGKWDARKMNNTWLKNNLKATAKHTTGINPVKMRYAQVLLYYAECMNELAGNHFLDQTSPSEMTAENTYASPYYTNLRVNKLYGGMAQDRTYAQDLSIVWNLNSDCELIDGLGSNATNTSSERGNMNYNMDPGWSKISGVWDAEYGIIEDANQIIEGIRSSATLTAGGANQKSMERSLGEALTIRAMVYFDLVRIFGDIPFKVEASKSDLSNAYLEKTDRDVIMDSLMNDLDEAIEYLPWADQATGYTTERTTKGYAHALLAQIAMTRAGYAIREKSKDGYETASYSDATYPTQRPGAADRKALYERALKHWSAIINDNTHNLNPSFENEWYLINQLSLDKTYHENLFEIPFGENVTGELGYTVGVRLSGVTTEYGYGNSSGKMKVTAPLLYSYDKKDTRRDITCANFEIKQDGSNTVENMLKNAPFGIYVGKWDARKMNNTWLKNNLKATAKHTTGINPVKMRYAQVLLYYAECMNELAGNPDANYEGSANGMTARQALEAVHTRAFNQADKNEAKAYVNNIASDKDAFFNALVQENMWEFAGEGIRKYDLIRWNLLAEKINEFKQTYLAELADGTYQKTIYFNYLDEKKTKIDFSSVTWYGIPDGKTSADYDGSIDSFGAAKLDTGSDTQVDVNLPSISSGLVGDNVAVKNRYLMPIASTTISATNGKIHNSYGYAD
jgi:starch-binding outer membrane protein, SusD/RagB family